MEEWITKLRDCLPRVRKDFYNDGLDLGLQYLSAVESIRARTSAEHDYQYFIDEVLYENYFLEYPWQPSVRQMLRPTQRSKYIDYLAQMRADWGTTLSLDPNFDKFCKFSDPIRWASVLREFERKKRLECLEFEYELNEAMGRKSSSLKASLVSIGRFFGYEINKSVGSAEKMMVFDDENNNSHCYSLRIVDLQALKKNGDVLVQYIFPEAPGKVFSLNHFVPGAYLYQQSNKSINTTEFSFFVQCAFMSRLCVGLRNFAA